MAAARYVAAIGRLDRGVGQPEVGDEVVDGSGWPEAIEQDVERGIVADAQHHPGEIAKAHRHAVTATAERQPAEAYVVGYVDPLGGVDGAGGDGTGERGGDDDLGDRGERERGRGVDLDGSRAGGTNGTHMEVHGGAGFLEQVDDLLLGRPRVDQAAPRWMSASSGQVSTTGSSTWKSAPSGRPCMTILPSVVSTT